MQQDGGDGIECEERMLNVRDYVTAFLPFKRTVVLINECLYTRAARDSCQESRQEKQCFFPDEILARVYRDLALKRELTVSLP